MPDVDHDTVFALLLAMGGPLVAAVGYWIAGRLRRAR
jgi:hypothetical protein